MGKKKQTWGIGDVFVVALTDSRFAVGQIIGREAKILNSVSIALFDQAIDSPTDAETIDMSAERAFATLFATRDRLDSYGWRVVSNAPVRIPPNLFPYESLRRSGFIGAKVIGSGIIERFIRAYFGLEAWDPMLDPEYFDKLLLSPDRKPSRVIYGKTAPPSSSN